MDYSHLKVFGCATYAHQYIKKLEPRSIKCIFLDYDENVKGYRLWVKSEKGYRVIVRKDVVFNETLMPCLEGKCVLTEKDAQIEMESAHIEQDTLVPEIEKTASGWSNIDPETKNDQSNLHDPIPLPLEEYQLTRNKERMEIRPSTRFDSNDVVSLFTY